MQRIFVVQIFPSRDDFAPLKRLCVDGLPIKQKERLMMKRIFAFLLTLILFKDGKIVDQKLGFQPKNALEDMIKKAL